MNTTQMDFLAVGQAYCTTLLPTLRPNHYGWMGVKNSYGWLGGKEKKQHFPLRTYSKHGEFSTAPSPIPSKEDPHFCTP